MPVPVIGIDVSELKTLAKALKTLEDFERAKSMKAALRGGADIVADEWRRRISPYSTKIAGSIKPGSSTSAAWVKAGGKKAPHAAAMENKGKSGKFRHPVFGNRKVWVDQTAHPTAIDALEASVDRAADKIEDALEVWLKDAGFDS